MPLNYEELMGDSARSIDAAAMRALIARHIDSDTVRGGPEYARLRDSGLAVWCLVAGMDPWEDSLEDLAEDYEVSPESVLAAIYYYWQHRDAIDRRIAQLYLPPPI
ncbi:MAG: hypothetical protein QJR03_08580 [Sphaerobacter sp.]|nr:hypothetical protein [Sphaerobacter sp.]